MALLTTGARRRPLLRAPLVLGWLAVLGVRQVAAQGTPVELEQQVKAAYLLNFTRYVDWPPGSFTGADDPVNLCVLGAEQFGDVVRQTVEGRRSRGRPVRVLVPDTPAQAADCHLAFLGGSLRQEAGWVTALAGRPTLTVGEGTGFLARGGTIAFVEVSQTVRFEVNLDAARRARLRISSRVLSLATRVRNEEGTP